MQHFFKNLAVMGGLLTLVVPGAGRFSLDARGSETASAARQPREEVGAALTH